jgi:HK97 family phage major capsid protein
MTTTTSPNTLRMIAGRKIREARSIHSKADAQSRLLTKDEEAQILGLLDAAREMANGAWAAEALEGEKKPIWRTLAEAWEWAEEMPERRTSALGPGHNPTTSYILPTAPASVPDVAPRRPARALDYYSLFPRASRSLEGFNSSGEFWDSVAYGQSHPGLRPVASMSGLSGGSGGFVIPSPIAAKMWDAAIMDSVLLSRVTTFPMESDTLRVCAWDETALSDTVDAGFTLQFLGELQEASRSTGAMRAITLNAHRAAIYCQASAELVADGQSFEQQLTSKLQSALSRGIDLTIVRGDGANKPLGIIAAPCTVSVSKETNQTAATVKFENVVKMFARILPSSVRNSVWLCHPTCLPQLLTMTLGVGSAGVWVPVLDQSSGNLTLLSRPVLLCEACSALGTVGDIILADLSAVLCGVRDTVSVERSTIPGWLTNAVDWRCQIRIDAEPALANPITGPRGDSLSPFVTLATRA